MIGQRVNNYEIQRLIGEGGMGAVYEAEHPLIRRKVAIKVLRNQLLTDAIAVQRFFSEARVTSAIRHPNIVEIMDVGTLPGGTPYLIMELLEGECLAKRLERRGRLDVEAALQLMLQAATGLEVAHAHGVVHRDLKPDHLFLIADERRPGRGLVKILDFGIAKLRRTLSRGGVETLSGVVMGTPIYMSPEQCSGLSSNIDHRTDIYALGVILYEALCGKPPFEAPGIGQILMMHTGTPPVPPSQHRPDLPPRVEQIVLRALAKRPSDRFSSMLELALAIRALLPPSGTSPALDMAQIDRAAAAQAEATQQSPLHPAPVQPRDAAAPHAASPPDHTMAGPDTLSLEGLRARPRRVLQLSLAAGAAVLVTLMVVLLRPWSVEPSSLHPVGGAGAVQPPPGPLATEASHAILPKPADSIAEASAREAKPVSKAPAAASRAPLGAGPGGGAKRETPAPPRTTSSTESRPQLLAWPEPPRSAEGLPSSPDPGVGQGYLSLDSAPWANVYVGGRLLGSTPLFRIALPPGKHELTLTNPELHRSTSYVVDIQAGGTLSRFVGWEQEGK